MELKAETAYHEILKAIDQIDPIRYGKTRNYINGAVTRLSPYISRGVISTRQVLQHVIKKGYKFREIQAFVKELCWRDYFQRVGQVKDLNQDIKQLQYPVLNYQIPSGVLTATTGIDAIDTAIRQLYCTGYMHNHSRMYTASLVCNIGKSYWLQPAKWMYYYLLDGDWASNACSWQWIAGANSSKKYYANQENINKYALTSQTDTFLDKSYAALETMEVPAQLSDPVQFIPDLHLPCSTGIKIDSCLPTFMYNYYNMDPEWHKDEAGNRILLIEPDFFARYPVNKLCIDFMLALGKNIPELQVYTGSFHSLITSYNLRNVFYKEHPFNTHYSGIAEARDWIATEITGYYTSFSSYWKQVEKILNKKYCASDRPCP